MPNLVEMLEYLLRRKWLALGVPVMMGVGGFFLAWFFPPYFSSEIKVWVDTGDESGLYSMVNASQSKSLSSLSNYIQGSSAISPEDLYVEVLTGREVALQAIERFRLDTLYKKKSNDLILKRFSRDLKLDVDQSGVISCSFEAKDKEMARDLLDFVSSRANEAYLRLQKERYKQSLEYLKELQSSLLDSLEQLNQKYAMFFRDNAIVDLKGQIQLTLSALAGYEEQIRNLRRSELSYGENTAAAQELRGKRKLLEAEYRKLRAGMESNAAADPNSVYVNTTWAVSKLVEMEQLEATLLRLAKIVEAIATEITMTEAKAMKNLPVVQILQEAYLPDWKTRPKRATWAVVAFFSSFLFVNIALLLQGIYNNSLNASDSVRQGMIRLFRSLKG